MKHPTFLFRQYPPYLLHWKGEIFKYSSQLVQEYFLDAKFHGLFSLYLMCILNVTPRIILYLGHDFSVIPLPHASFGMSSDLVLWAIMSFTHYVYKIIEYIFLILFYILIDEWKPYNFTSWLWQLVSTLHFYLSSR